MQADRQTDRQTDRHKTRSSQFAIRRAPYIVGWNNNVILDESLERRQAKQHRTRYISREKSVK